MLSSCFIITLIGEKRYNYRRNKYIFRHLEKLKCCCSYFVYNSFNFFFNFHNSLDISIAYTKTITTKEAFSKPTTVYCLLNNFFIINAKELSSLASSLFRGIFPYRLLIALSRLHTQILCSELHPQFPPPFYHRQKTFPPLPVQCYTKLPLLSGCGKYFLRGFEKQQHFHR